MIASLRGVVAGRSGNSVIVDVNGVGYLVQVSERTLAAVGGLGDGVFLVVETQVREDAITLIGFPDVEERDVFRMLTSVQGVGSRIGLAILSVLTPEEVLAALVNDERRALTQANGVAQKLATRLVTELRDKAAAMAPAVAAGVIMLPGRAHSGDEDAARAALTTLGFSKTEVQQYVGYVMSLPNPPSGTSALVTACLKVAGQRAA